MEELFKKIVVDLSEEFDVLSASGNELLSLLIIGVPYYLVLHAFLHGWEFSEDFLERSVLNDTHVTIRYRLCCIQRI